MELEETNDDFLQRRHSNCAYLLHHPDENELFIECSKVNPHPPDSEQGISMKMLRRAV